MKPVLIYGCYGYTGRLIVDWGREQGLPMLLSGRNSEKVAAMAKEFDLPGKACSLDDSEALEALLSEVAVVVHCAGPFFRTYKAMAKACLSQGVHYLDITGEIIVFEGLAAMDAEAKEKGVMLLPGVGFDVVPTDCMGAHLKQLLPDAEELELAFRSVGGGLSHGTASTVIAGLGAGSLLRRNGVIVQVPAGKQTVQADFGRGPVEAVGIPWGDVSTAFHTTGIRNVTTYTVVPPRVARFMRLSNRLGRLLQHPAVQRFLQRRVDKAPAGPTAEARERGRSLVWGRVRNLKGEVKCARLTTVNGYTLTALGAVHTAQQVLAGKATPGFQTPAGWLGPGLLQELDPEASFVALSE